MDIIQITEQQLNNALDSVAMTGVAVGIIMGLFIAVFLFVMMPVIRQRNFKQWMLEKKDKERDDINKKLSILYIAVEDLANVSNTQLFKSMHNQMCRLKSYLSQKWLQS